MLTSTTLPPTFPRFIAPGEALPEFAGPARDVVADIFDDVPVFERPVSIPAIGDILTDAGVISEHLDGITVADPSYSLWLTVFDSRPMAPFKKPYEELITTVGERMRVLTRTILDAQFVEATHLPHSKDKDRGGAIVLLLGKTDTDRVRSESNEIRAILRGEQIEGAPKPRRASILPQVKVGRSEAGTDPQNIETILAAIRKHLPVTGNLESALVFDEE